MTQYAKFPKLDIIGKRFGNLVVLELSNKKSKYGKLIYNCLCDCGNYKSVLGNSLNSNRTKSCGCLRANRIDFTNKKIGKLTVIKSLNKLSKWNDSYWECICDCGNKVIRKHNSLLNSITKNKNSSCGECKNSYLIGQKFERMTVKGLIKQTNYYRYKNRILCNCLCDCGNIKLIVPTDLINGRVKSCGCLHLELVSGASNFNFKHGLAGTKEYQKEMNSRRRIRLLGGNNSGNLKISDIKKKFDNLGNKCVYCVDGVYEHIDHVVPLSRGGTHSLDNLLPSCKKCNFSKHNKILFLEWQPKIMHNILKDFLKQ